MFLSKYCCYRVTPEIIIELHHFFLYASEQIRALYWSLDPITGQSYPVRYQSLEIEDMLFPLLYFCKDGHHHGYLLIFASKTSALTTEEWTTREHFRWSPLRGINLDLICKPSVRRRALPKSHIVKPIYISIPKKNKLVYATYELKWFKWIGAHSKIYGSYSNHERCSVPYQTVHHII